MEINTSMIVASIVGGGTITAVIGWVLSQLAWIPEIWFSQLAKIFKTNIMIREALNSNSQTQGLIRFLQSVGNRTLQENIQIKNGIGYNTSVVSGFYFIPELMKTNRVLAFLSVSEIENKSGGNSSKVTVTSFQLTIVGLHKDRIKLSDDMFSYIKNYTNSLYDFDVEKEMIYIDIVSKNSNWDTVDIALSKKRKRSINSVFLQKKDKDRIVTFVDRFMNNKSMYEELSVGYKAGILLYGEPGTGKTSIINALCSEFGMILITLKTTTSISNLKQMIEKFRKDQFDDGLDVCKVRQNVNKSTILVAIEEIDRYIEGGDKSEGAISRNNQLMQLLDGLDSPENVLFVATTNNYDALDKALVRPGRFDLSIEIPKMTKDIAEEMCLSMIGKTLSEFDATYLEHDTINSSKLFGELIQHNMKKYIEEIK